MPKAEVDPRLAAKVRALSDRELGRFLRRSRQFREKRTSSKTTRSRAPLWTQEELALLGTRSDRDLARLLGRTLTAITLRRSRLGIPCLNPLRKAWSEAEIKLLGTMSDADLAARLKVSERIVCGRRESRHVPVFNRKLHQWNTADDKRLGKIKDEDLAKQYGVSVNAIKHRRTRLGIYLPKKLKRTRFREEKPWTASELELLGKINDREIAKRTGHWVHFVRWKREALGIRTPFLKRWNSEDDRLLGKVPDAEIARRTGRSIDAVSLRRQALARQSIRPHHQRRWSAREERLLGTAPDKTIARKLGLHLFIVMARRRFRRIPAWESLRGATNP